MKFAIHTYLRPHNAKIQIVVEKCGMRLWKCMIEREIPIIRDVATVSRVDNGCMKRRYSTNTTQ